MKLIVSFPVGAIAGGAQIAYLPEKGIKLQDLVYDIERLKNRFKHCKTTSLGMYSCQLLSH
jgi:hypothetical protein